MKSHISETRNIKEYLAGGIILLLFLLSFLFWGKGYFFLASEFTPFSSHENSLQSGTGSTESESGYSIDNSSKGFEGSGETVSLPLLEVSETISGSFSRTLVGSQEENVFSQRIASGTGSSLIDRQWKIFPDTVSNIQSPIEDTKISFYPRSSLSLGHSLIFSVGVPKDIHLNSMTYTWTVTDYMGNIFSTPSASSLFFFLPPRVGIYTVSVRISDGTNIKDYVSIFKISPKILLSQ